MIRKPKTVAYRLSTEEEAAIKAVAERMERTAGQFSRLVTLRVVQELAATQNEPTKTSGQTLQAA